MSNVNVVSPSRNYVAICNKPNFDGHYLRRFHLPERTEDWMTPFHLDNNAEIATWYFLNWLDAVACVEMVITEEAYLSIQPTKEE